MAEWLKAPESGYATGQMRQELTAQRAGSNPATSTKVKGDSSLTYWYNKNIHPKAG